MVRGRKDEMGMERKKRKWVRVKRTKWSWKVSKEKAGNRGTDGNRKGIVMRGKRQNGEGEGSVREEEKGRERGCGESPRPGSHFRMALRGFDGRWN